MRNITIHLGFVVFAMLAALGVLRMAFGEPATAQQRKTRMPDEPKVQETDGETEVATFGAGCFWCVEAVFQRLQGVISVESGYAGGRVDNPTYKQVCTGATGHAEVCQIRYDPAKIRFDELLEVFWKTHDPTTLNRQGADVGTQYRSVIFYHDDQQREQAELRKKQLNESGAWSAPIVTEISPLTRFYKAEDYHQNYFRENPQQGYCRFVIRPKLEKFEKVFRDKLKQGP
jgi:peptide-methionine (S)-S-oxide reductase